MLWRLRPGRFDWTIDVSLLLTLFTAAEAVFGFGVAVLVLVVIVVDDLDDLDDFLSSAMGR